jgi:predicted PurR-regulated permease PerM
MDDARAGDAGPAEPLPPSEVRDARGRTGATPGQVIFTLGRRQRRLVDLLLILAVAALSFVVFGFATAAFFAFGDIILTFFLAWLIAFVLSPIVERIGRLIPRLPRVVAVVIVYLALLATVGVVVALVAEALVRSISDFVAQIPTLQERLPEILAPIQQQLEQVGLKLDLVVEVNRLIQNIGEYATQLIGPLQSIAVASLGILGTTLIVVILSLYIIIDAANIRAFAYRLVPPQYHEQWGVFEGSVSRSFGGFLRGQVAMGLVYGLIAAGASLAFGLQFAAVTSAASGILQMIPFFGPFVSWAPPVLVAVFTKPEAILPTLIVMGIGWFFVMNVLQPRLMQHAVGLHPIVVLASVLIGSKIAGVAGAIFGIPIAAVLTSIFFYYFQIFGGDRTVRERAARLVEERGGQAVRVPREPTPGVDLDIADPPTT